MSERSLEQNQRIAARTAGAIFLLVLGLFAFKQFVLSPEIFVSGNAEATANNIHAAAGAFRSIVGIDLFIALADVILGVSIYVMLRPVSRDLALLSLSYRLIECAILGVITIFYFTVLLLLGGDDYLMVFEAAQLNALSWLLIRVYVVGYLVGVIFFSLGSIVYSYLLFKSNYIPRLLAVWGIFASLVLFVWLFAYFLAPEAAISLFPLSMLPIAVYELLLGLWLLLKGVNLRSRQTGISAS